MLERIAQMPGAFPKRDAAKWSAIMTQPVSQILETRVSLCWATEAKAPAKRPTAAKSGSTVQFTTFTSATKIHQLIESTLFARLPSLFCSTD
jgi:hypothetical protein